MKTNLSRVVSWAVEHPWAITPDMLRVVGSVLARRLVGLDGDDAPTVAALVPPADPRPVRTTSYGVAVLPIHGVLAPRINMLSDISGGATFEEASTALTQLARDPDVATIVLDWDSPGGSVAGAGEFAAVVGRVAASKRVISVANYACCSAAYWAAARSTEVVAAPSALVGSIGVYCLHEDVSQYLANEGIVHTYISAGAFKADGNPSVPLSDSARGHLEAMVSHPYGRFVADVAAGRHVTVDAVVAGFGQGRSLTADDALRAGLIDRIDTLDAVIAGAATLPPLTMTAARIGRSASELAIGREIASLGLTF